MVLNIWNFKNSYDLKVALIFKCYFDIILDMKSGAMIQAKPACDSS